MDVRIYTMNMNKVMRFTMAYECCTNIDLRIENAGKCRKYFEINNLVIKTATYQN